MSNRISAMIGKSLMNGNYDNHRDKVRKEIIKLTQQYFSEKPGEEFKYGVTKIPLNVPSYGWEECVEAFDSLISTWVTMGEKVSKFERMFAEPMQ